MTHYTAIFFQDLTDVAASPRSESVWGTILAIRRQAEWPALRLEAARGESARCLHRDRELRGGGRPQAADHRRAGVHAPARASMMVGGGRSAWGDRLGPEEPRPTTAMTAFWPWDIGMVGGTGI